MKPVVIAGAILMMSGGALAVPLQSDHAVLRAVPAPGAVTIDGQLDDWDTSGAMLVYPVRNIRDRYAVQVAAMWAPDALYLGLKWRDPTPLINNVDAERAPHEGWMSDALQARFITDYAQIHLTSWYGSKSDTSVAHISYDAPVNPANEKLVRARGKVLRDGSGFQQAFTEDRDHRGYVQEIRLPWTLLYRNPAPAAGLKFRFTGEYMWGGPSGIRWPAVMWSDPINQAQPQRIVLYQSPQNWGAIELLAQGNVPREDLGENEALLQGPVTLKLAVPKHATKFTVAIDNASGKRVRNLLAHANVSDYAVKTDGDWRHLEVSWDGRADGEWDKQRLLFLGDVVSAGTYTARVLFHDGIGVIYAGNFYNPGNPPWITAEGTGAWLADHSAPAAVGVMTPDAPGRLRVFLGAPVVECGLGFIALDATHQKRWEWGRRGSGAQFIAPGTNGVYFTFSDNTLGRLNPDTGDQLPLGGQPEIKLPATVSGLAAHGGQVAVSFTALNKVQILDGASGALVRELTADYPAGLAFRSNGELVIISTNQPLYGVARPLAVACDARDRIYVADGAEQNVKVFTPDGNRVATIGEAGGHPPGKWNAQQMQNPVALAIDERAQGAPHLWIAEANFSPKRVSVWDTATGKLVKDYIGTTRYMAAGGAMSDDDPNLGLADGVFFRVDLAKQTYTPLEVIADARLGDFANGNHFISEASGKRREYYVEGAVSPVRVYLRRGGIWRTVAELGPDPQNGSGVFSWSDVNGDGQHQDDEVQRRDCGNPNVLRGGWGYRCHRDLAWYHSGLAFRPVRFTADGAPVYDVTQAQPLPGELARVSGDIYATTFGFTASDSLGQSVDKHNTIHGLNFITGYDAHGVKRWSYPNYWVAVHGAFTAPAAMPGVVMGALKTTGISPLGAHSLISIRGNIGQEFLLRDDGLYVAELFTDLRSAPSGMPPERDIVGVPINDTTIGGEPFNGWMGRQRDGKVRMTYGETDVRVAEVVGLNTVGTMQPITIALAEEQVAACRAFTPGAGAAAPKTSHTVVRGGAFDVNAVAFGDDAIVVRAGREEVGRALLRYDDQNLYVAWEAFDATPMANKGAFALEAFKTGDSVNLYLGQEDTPGMRVLLTALAGKPTTVVYKPAGPGNKPHDFKSPVRTTRFAYVSEEPAIVWQARTVPGREYIVAATIPWAILGLTPTAGLTLNGDIGLLFGDDSGTRTSQRVQWVDKETNVVNDTPTEAEFSPVRWGTFVLQ